MTGGGYFFFAGAFLAGAFFAAGAFLAAVAFFAGTFFAGGGVPSGDVAPGWPAGCPMGFWFSSVDMSQPARRATAPSGIVSQVGRCRAS